MNLKIYRSNGILIYTIFWLNKNIFFNIILRTIYNISEIHQPIATGKYSGNTTLHYDFFFKVSKNIL